MPGAVPGPATYRSSKKECPPAGVRNLAGGRCLKRRAPMPELRIVLDGEGAFPELADASKVIHIQDFAVTALEAGMESGRPSVAFIFELPDGKVVFAETSMRLFQLAAQAFKTKYGDVNADPAGSI